MDPAAGQRSRAGDRLLLAGLALLATALFASTLSRAIQPPAGGELVAAACGGGVAHPPGYPLYTMLGNLLCRVPLSTPAARVGLLSLLAGVIGVLAVFGIIRRLTGSRWAAMVAALVLASGSLYWRYASLAEVFALHVALCLLLVYAVVRASLTLAPLARGGWLALSALLAGLALANHLSSLLVLPLLIVPLVAPHDGWLALAGRTLVTALALLAGLVPYLYLFAADPLALPHWGPLAPGWAGWHHVLGHDYAAASVVAGPFAAPAALLATLPQQLGWLLAPLSLWGLVLLFARAAGRPLGEELPLRRDLAAGLALAPLVTGPLWLLLFDIAPQGIGRQLLERFFLLPIALFVLPLGLALAWLERRFLFRLHGARRTLARGAAFGVVALVALASYGRADVSQAYAAEDYAENALASAHRGALILGQGDGRFSAFLYAQRVLGLRKDVQYVDVRLLGQAWYRRQQRWLFADFSYRDGERVDGLRLIQRALRRGRAVYLASHYSQRVRTAFQVYPWGPLLRVVDPAQRPPALAELLAGNTRLFRGFRCRGPVPKPAQEPWSAALREPFARAWIDLGQRLRRRGATQPARHALVRGLRWAPWLADRLQAKALGLLPAARPRRR